MKSSVYCRVGCLAGVWAFAAFGALSASALEITVGADEADRTLTPAEVASLVASDEDLVKKGAGRLVITNNLAGYAGEIRLEAGYLRCLEIGSLGDATKGTIVSDGATLEFGYPTNGKLILAANDGYEHVTVSGTGMNGIGALYHLNKGGEQWCRVFGKITLAGDTLFGGESYVNSSKETNYRRYDIRGKELTLNGHTLTIKALFGICGATIVPDAGDAHGKIVVDGAGTSFTYEGGDSRFGGSAANTLVLTNGASLSSQDGGPEIAWTVEADNGRFRATKAPTALRNMCINGPVKIGFGGLTVGSSYGGWMTLGGKISGTGKLSLAAWNSKQTVFYLKDATSDWTGGLAVTGPANVYAVALPGAETPGLYSANSSSRIYCTLPTGDSDDSTIYAAYTNLVRNLGSSYHLCLYAASGAPVTNARDIVATPVVHRYQADDVLQLKGEMRDAHLYALGGDIEITGDTATRTFDDLFVADGTLTFRDAGRFETSTNHITVGATYPKLPWLKLENTTYATNYAECVNNKHEDALTVGPLRDVSKDNYSIEAYGKNRGAVEIGPGAALTNLIYLGKPNEATTTKCSCHGSVFIRGGELCISSAIDYKYSWVGCYGSGYLGLESGSLAIRGFLYPGGGSLGRGAVYVSGGKMFSDSNYFIFGQYSSRANPGMGVLYVNGGSADCNLIIMGKTLWDPNNAGSRDQVTLANGTLSAKYGMDLAGEPFGESILNLNGGVFSCNYIQVITNQLQTLVGTGKDVPVTNSIGYVNFNGGTYRFLRNNTGKAMYKAGTMFVGDPTHLRITSYGAGATFDTQSYAATNIHAICAPTGLGIASIALPADFANLPDWAYAGAPVVEIEGDGSGASAVAEFDSTHGRVTSITVTSPGCDYTTATAKLSHGGFTNKVSLTVTLGTPVAGGFTKTGSGSLLLGCANTYGGKTTLREGTLIAGCAGAIPAGSAVEFAGGTLDLNGQTRDFGAVVASSGSLANASGTMTSFTKTGDGTFFFNAPVTVAGTLDVQGGTLVLPVKSPGLYAGEKIYQSGESHKEYDNHTPLTNLPCELTPSHAYDRCETGGYYQPDHYVIYSGYVWNNQATDVAWTFAFAFDDTLTIYIDGKALATTKRSTVSWGSLYTAQTTLTPGPHRFQLSLYNGLGIGGAIISGNVKGNVNWRKDIEGFAYDPAGNNSTNGNDYVHMVDPGDGSLFTREIYDNSTLPTITNLCLAGGTTLDFFGGTWTYNGELKFAESVLETPVSVNGTFAFGDTAIVAVEGAKDLPVESLPKTILTTTDGVTGKLPALSDRMRFKRTNGGKDLAVDIERGMLLFLR